MSRDIAPSDWLEEAEKMYGEGNYSAAIAAATIDQAATERNNVKLLWRLRKAEAEKDAAPPESEPQRFEGVNGSN